MKKINTLVFDFGGVIFDISIPLALNALANEGIHLDFNSRSFNQVFISFEKGLISPVEFIDYMVTLGDGNTKRMNVVKAFNRVLLGINEEPFENLKRLAVHYKLYLLSNINVIHYDECRRMIQEDNKLSEFDRLFTRQYYSFQIKMRKPDQEIFEHIIMDSNLDPATCLFIDDYTTNIEGAARSGFNTHLFIPGTGWPELISTYQLKLD